MVEAMRLPAARQPHAARGLQKAVGAEDVGVDEGVRPGDRTVNMALGGKMHDGGDVALAQQLFDQRGVADVAHHQFGRAAL